MVQTDRSEPSLPSVERMRTGVTSDSEQRHEDMTMNTDIVSAVQVLILMGLPTLALLGMGMWVLRREFGGVARGVGFLIIALGSVLGIVTFTTVLFGIVGVMEGVRALM